MEGLFVIMETTESAPSVDYVLQNIDDLSYSDAFDCLKRIFNELKCDPEEYRIILDYFSLKIWTLFKTSSDNVKSKLETFPDIEFVNYNAIKQNINGMFKEGKTDCEIISETGNSDLIMYTIREEKANQLLHRVKDCLIPQLKDLIIK